MMKHLTPPISDPRTTGRKGTLLPPCTESSIDEGVWLELEHYPGSPGTTPKINKNILVSLQVTPEDADIECSLSQNCKNQLVRKYLKTNDQTDGQK